MALTPSRVVLLFAATLVLSILGVVLMLMGVHGSQILTILGGILLLPNVVLMRLGVPIGIPIISSTSLISVLIFACLQAAYYYGVFRLMYFIRRRRPSSPSV